jgi:cytochrome c-type biogenesis protein CcmE
MRPKHKRLTFVVVGLGLLGVATALALSAAQSGITFFHTPTEVSEKGFPPDRRIRIGGLVEQGSVDRSGGATVAFKITDMAHAVNVRYTGLLPDLFAEGQGVVAEGFLKAGVFVADEVLAKHDENYMPPEASAALKESGYWQHMKDQQASTPEKTK